MVIVIPVNILLLPPTEGKLRLSTFRLETHNKLVWIISRMQLRIEEQFNTNFNKNTSRCDNRISCCCCVEYVGVFGSDFRTTFKTGNPRLFRCLTNYNLNYLNLFIVQLNSREDWTYISLIFCSVWDFKSGMGLVSR